MAAKPSDSFKYETHEGLVGHHVLGQVLASATSLLETPALQGNERNMVEATTHKIDGKLYVKQDA